jgi:hypothetical protein
MVMEAIDLIVQQLGTSALTTGTVCIAVCLLVWLI